MTSSQIKTCLCLVILLALVSAGTVTSQGSTYSVTPTTVSLSSSITLNFGGINYSWQRSRSLGTWNRFGQQWFISTAGIPTCKIECAPYSFPVSVGGKLFCQRTNHTTLFTKSQPSTSNNFKKYCLPNIDGFLCASETTNLYPAINGECKTASLPPLTGYTGSNYDCCFNNANYDQNLLVNQFSDRWATI